MANPEQTCLYRKETGECLNFIAWGYSGLIQRDDFSDYPNNHPDFVCTHFRLETTCAVPIVTLLAGLFVDQEDKEIESTCQV